MFASMEYEVFMTEGSLEVKLPEVGRVKEEKKRKWEEQRREKERRKKMQAREKVVRSRLTVFFQWFVAPEGRKVGSLKRRVRSQLATPQLRSTFRSCDVEKVHAAVARSTSPSQNVQNTSASDHF